MNEMKLSRRDFLVAAGCGCAGLALATSGCSKLAGATASAAQATGLNWVHWVGDWRA